MALIKCSECGHEISSEAEYCPNCGYKTYAGRQKEEEKNEAVYIFVFSLIGFTMIIVSIILICVWYSNLSEWNQYFLKRWEFDKVDFSGLFWRIILLAVGTGVSIGAVARGKRTRTQTTSAQTTQSSHPLLNSQHGEWRGWKCPKCHIKNSEYATKCKCGFVKKW